jgi:hypothetical protein
MLRAVRMQLIQQAVSSDLQLPRVTGRYFSNTRASIITALRISASVNRRTLPEHPGLATNEIPQRVQRSMWFPIYPRFRRT